MTILELTELIEKTYMQKFQNKDVYHTYKNSFTLVIRISNLIINIFLIFLI